MTKLCKLARKYKCDKGPMKHNYTPIYHKYLSRLQNKHFNILEIGFGKGSSVKMWLSYFKKANICCIDNGKIVYTIEDERYFPYKGDQSDLYILKKVAFNHSIFDVIIDDGSHLADHQQLCLGVLFPYLKEGGYYFIEDLNCPRGKRSNFAKPTINVAKEYIKTNKLRSPVVSKKQKEYITTNCKKCKTFQDKICLFIKRNNNG